MPLNDTGEKGQEQPRRHSSYCDMLHLCKERGKGGDLCRKSLRPQAVLRQCQPNQRTTPVQWLSLEESHTREMSRPQFHAQFLTGAARESTDLFKYYDGSQRPGSWRLLASCPPTLNYRNARTKEGDHIFWMPSTCSALYSPTTNLPKG